MGSKTKENILEYLFGGSGGAEKLENNINVNIGYPGSAPLVHTGSVVPADKSEDLIHKFLGGGGGRGGVAAGLKYSAGFVQLLSQIARHRKLTPDMKKKLFNTALSLVSAPGLVSGHNIRLLPYRNPKSYSDFRRRTHHG